MIEIVERPPVTRIAHGGVIAHFGIGFSQRTGTKRPATCSEVRNGPSAAGTEAELQLTAPGSPSRNMPLDNRVKQQAVIRIQREHTDRQSMAGPTRSPVHYG